MATDTLNATPITQAASKAWLDEAIFVLFLLAVFIGVTPFKNGDALSGEVVVQSGAGDMLRQLCYLGIFALIGWRAYLRRGIEVFAVLPPILMLLIAWCMASALWSPEPDVTMRRAGLAAVLVISAMLSIDALEPNRSMDLWRWVLFGVLIINLISVKFVPAAVHSAGEIDPQLVGNWRGIYGHKNIAGSVAAITVLLFLFRKERTFVQRCFDFLVIALAAVFLIGSHSKSSLGLLLVAIAAGLAYRVAFQRQIDRTIMLVALALMTVIGAVAVMAEMEVIQRVLADPTQFTGRTAIWQAEWAYIADHPIFGSGFGAFSGTGKTSPLTPYISSWVTGVHHGHNGYLQLLVTIGGTGFALAMLSLLLAPMAAFWRRGDTALKSLLFALFAFLVLHNLMETDFLEGDGVTWVAFLLMLAMLRGREEEAL